MRKPEDIIENHLITQCKKRRFMCLKFRSPGFNGVPDRLVIGNGHLMFIELKRPGRDLDPLQRAIAERMRSHGADVRMADTKERVNELLAELDALASGKTPHAGTARTTPDINHLLRAQLERAAPDCTPEQIDHMMATAAALGKTLKTTPPTSQEPPS